MVDIIYVEHDGTTHRVNATIGSTLMETAVANAVPGIDAECGGECICSTCQVFIDPADLDKLPTRRSNEIETLAQNGKHSERARLGCQIEITDALNGLVVQIPASQH